MMGFADLRGIVLPHELLEHGHETLRSIGSQHIEGLILWVGQRSAQSGGSQVFVVEAVLTPAQRAMRAEDGGLCVIVDSAELHRINGWLYEHRMQLIAQVHSHPTDAYHSALDDTIPIATTVGALSLVVPDFASGPADLRTYTGYRLSIDGLWMELTADELCALVQVTSDEDRATVQPDVEPGTSDAAKE